MAYFKPFKSFVVCTIDGVDAELPTMALAKSHKKELRTDHEMESTIYEVTGSEGHDESDAIHDPQCSLDQACRDYMAHNLTAKRMEKAATRWGVTIVKH